MRKSYRGRFAPSPTGPLHFGSLVAALGSYLDAKANGGQWLLRMEDLDTPRNVAGAAQQIMRQLEACALYWDGEVTWQSRRIELYQQALAHLKQAGCVYPCGCSRKEIADSSLSGIEGPVYPGTCRNGLAPGRKTRAWRVRVDQTPVAFDDARAGHLEQNLARDIGDFVLLRADGVFAYQLAVVVDDAEQGISDVVRGADLLLSTPRQIYLQRLLGLPTPRYRHLAVALNAQGEKLSKQTHAPAIQLAEASGVLCQALAFLGYTTPSELQRASSEEIIAWATRFVHRSMV